MVPSQSTPGLFFTPISLLNPALWPPTAGQSQSLLELNLLQPSCLQCTEAMTRFSHFLTLIENKSTYCCSTLSQNICFSRLFLPSSFWKGFWQNSSLRSCSLLGVAVGDLGAELHTIPRQHSADSGILCSHWDMCMLPADPLSPPNPHCCRYWSFTAATEVH